MSEQDGLVLLYPPPSISPAGVRHNPPAWVPRSQAGRRVLVEGWRLQSFPLEGQA